MLEPALIEYIVVHELAHLSVRNHSPDFKKLMSSVLPDFRDSRNDSGKWKGFFLCNVCSNAVRGQMWQSCSVCPEQLCDPRAEPCQASVAQSSHPQSLPYRAFVGG